MSSYDLKAHGADWTVEKTAQAVTNEQAALGIAQFITDVRAKSDGTGPLPAPTLQAVTADDLQFLGTFSLLTGGGGDPQWGDGLAIRHKNGQRRAFQCSWNPQVVLESLIPEVLGQDSLDAPQSTLIKNWGDPAGPFFTGDKLFGLYWDEADQRLYWTTLNTYNTQSALDPTVGYAQFEKDANDTDVLVPKGIWGLQNRSCKMAGGGVLAVPKWFSDAYAPGMRLGAGFGGYFSIAAVGPVSMGPALSLFDPAELIAGASQVPTKFAVGYPFNGTPYTVPDRCHRDTDYRTEFDAWVARNGVGYWSWSDYIWQGGVWIDTPTKSGLMFLPTLGNGRTWYEDSTLHAEAASHAWMIYSPDDVMKVVTNQVPQSSIQPVETKVQYPGIVYPLVGWANEPGTTVVGSTFDPIDRRLYISVRFANGVKAGSRPVVFVYTVKD